VIAADCVAVHWLTMLGCPSVADVADCAVVHWFTMLAVHWVMRSSSIDCACGH
jgi:hypothetical protein